MVRRGKKKRIRYVGRRYSIRVLLIFLILTLTVFFFFQSPYFDVSAIGVLGNSTLTKPQVRKLSGVVQGTNIFRVDTKAVEKKLLLNPFVASVEVKRDLPQTISIKVVEYEALAVIPVNGNFIEVSKEGYCLRHCSEISKLDLPVASGLKMKKATPPGSKVEEDYLPLAMEILNQANQNGIIAEVDVSDIQRINLYTFSNTKILLGDKSQLEEKISLALDIASRVPHAEYIDVRFPKSPVYK